MSSLSPDATRAHGCRPGPAGFAFGCRVLRRVGRLCFADPAQERLVGDNRDQFLQLLIQLLAEPEQPPFLLVGRHQPLRQPCPQDPVLFFQIRDLAGQILTGNRGQQGEERMQNAAHFSTVVRRWNLLRIRGNQSFLTPLEGWPKYPVSAPLPTAMTPPQTGSARLVRR